jgi:O-antigen/teichoic acid export membrane protein
MGAASVLSILSGLIRTKAAAVLLGPAGIGNIGLLQNLLAISATLFSVGFRTAGTRQIAEAVATDDKVAIAAARRALFWGTLVLAVVGALIFALLHDAIAIHVLNDPASGGEVRWLAIGVALSVAAGSQTALLTGLRQIGNIARIGVASSVLATIIGVAALLRFGENGVLIFVLVSPITAFLLGHWYVRRLGPIEGPATPFNELAAQWRVLAVLGAAFLMSNFIEVSSELVVRTLLKRDLGAGGLGNFQAAWTISMTYMGLVLSSMSADYYPRLVGAMNDHSNANRLVNEQTEVALLLAAPVLLTIVGLAPWIIALLYSSDFSGAVSILRWQVLGDVLKVASWPLGYLILAAGDGRGYLVSAAAMSGLFVGLTWIGLPQIGLQAAGVAVFGMYAGYLTLASWLAHRRTGLRWQRRVWVLQTGLLMTCAFVFASAAWSKWLGAAFGLAFALTFTIYGVDRLGRLIAPGGRAGQVVAMLGWLRMKVVDFARG